MIAAIDIETTGLDPERHEIWEVAYVLENDGDFVKEEHFLLPVTLQNADPTALRIGGFYERGVPDQPDITARHLLPSFTRAKLLADLDGAILVGNNPAFDAAFLRKFIGSAPWHYHVVDVKALVAGRLGLTPPWSSDQLFELAKLEPRTAPHTAANDAERALALYHFALSL